MSSLTTLPAVLVFLEQARFVLSTCGNPNNPAAAVTITGDSIAANAYNQCLTMTSLVIASTVTLIGKYTIITMILTIYLLKRKKSTKYSNCNILFYFH